MERPEFGTAGSRIVSGRRRRHRSLDIERNDGVDRRIEDVDAVELSIEHLDAADLARREGCRRLCQRCCVEINTHESVLDWSRRNRRRILPEADFGISSVNSTNRMCLYEATCSATNA